MAGDWIKMRTDLSTSPKVVRIASALRADRFRTVGALHAVWCLFDAHSLDGKLEGYTLGTVDDLIGFSGFAEAMASVGWLIESAEGIELPRFDDHNGSSAKRRAMESDRKRKGRLSASNADAEADELRTREEKRREENKDQKPLSPDGDDGEKKISFSAIADLYNKICGGVLPRCVALNAKRKNNIRNLCSLTINGCKPFRDLDFWEGYFNDCLTNRHWTGDNDRGWRADLEFLTRQEVALKALEAA